MIAALITLSCIVGWLFTGYIGGWINARHTYRHSKREYHSLGPSQWEDDARIAYALSLLMGPFALLWAFGVRVVNGSVASVVPEIAERIEKDRAEEQVKRIRALEAELDAAHRSLGIAPLRRDAAS